MMRCVLPELLIDSLRYEPIWIKITSGSMAPCIPEGASVLVAKPTRILISDILIYRHKDELIAHRLIRRLKTGVNGDTLYQTKADAGYSLDEPIKLEDILGKAIAIKRKDKMVRLNTFSGRLNAFYFLFLSLARLIIHKYVKI